MNHHLLSLSGQDLIKGLQAGQWSLTDVVDSCIAHLQRHHDRLNALVIARFSEARQEAQRMPSQAFSGVPFVSKEMLSAAGLPLTMGSWYRHADMAINDATVIQRLRAAGGILLGQTNQGEMGLGLDSDNIIYGCSKNPWDHHHTCGEDAAAAVVGSGGAPLALSGDIIGNTLVSAHFCGVFAHRPSRSLVPLTGYFPLTEDEPAANQSGWAQVGSIALLSHHVDDLVPLLHTIAGSDAHDPWTLTSLPLSEPPSDIHWHIHVWKNPCFKWCPLPTEDMQDALIEAAEDLVVNTAGELLEVDSHSHPHPLALWAATCRRGLWQWVDILARGDRIALGTEWWRWLLRSRHSKHTRAALLGGILERWARLNQPQYGGKQVEHLREQWIEKLPPGHLLIMPVFPTVAPRLGHWTLFPWGYAYTALWAVLGFPVTVVPLGFNWQGLPMGVQIIGAPGMDLWTLQAAAHLAKVRSVWQVPRFNTLR